MSWAYQGWHPAGPSLGGGRLDAVLRRILKLPPDSVGQGARKAMCVTLARRGTWAVTSSVCCDRRSPVSVLTAFSRPAASGATQNILARTWSRPPPPTPSKPRRTRWRSHRSSHSRLVFVSESEGPGSQCPGLCLLGVRVTNAVRRRGAPAAEDTLAAEGGSHCRARTVLSSSSTPWCSRKERSRESLFPTRWGALGRF